MRKRPPTLPLFFGLSLFATGLAACGDDGNTESSDETGDTGETAGDGDGDPTGDGDGDPTGDGDGDPTGDGDGDPTGDGDGDPTGDGDGDPTGDGDGDPTGDGDGDPGDCMAWEITYDLTGSEFEISGTPLMAGDQVNTVMEPYDEDDHIGPGNFVLHFQDVDGAPGGQAFMNSYEMSINFVVSGATTVTTDLEVSAGPEECGITSGAVVDGTIVEWMPAAIVGNHSMGTILCEGALCGLGGLPNGEPVPQDETSDQPLNEFVFSDDLSSFQMEEIVVQEEPNVSVASWMYTGTEVSRDLVPAPDCLCD